MGYFEHETSGFIHTARLYLWKHVLKAFMVTHILKDVTDKGAGDLSCPLFKTAIYDAVIYQTYMRKHGDSLFFGVMPHVT